MCEAFEAERKRTHDELTEHQTELSYRATHDELTGLASRALVFDGVERALARAARSRSEVAVLFIDIDRFKSVNDTYGHAVGDHLLVFVAERLNEVVRDADMLGRLGGDEFVVVAEGISRADDAEVIANRVLSAVRRPFPLGGVTSSELDTSVSIGIAIGSAGPAEEMLRNADFAMYRAKWTGRDRYAFYEPDMGVALQSGADHQDKLHMAVEGD
jgi:diguanylate cyclase (GGDEF)-like protein